MISAGSLASTSPSVCATEVPAVTWREQLQHDDERFGYVSTVGALRDRLQLHGYTSTRALRELDAAVAVWHGRHPNPGADAMGVPVRGSAELLAELREYVNGTHSWGLVQPAWVAAPAGIQPSHLPSQYGSVHGAADVADVALYQVNPGSGTARDRQPGS